MEDEKQSYFSWNLAKKEGRTSLADTDDVSGHKAMLVKNRLGYVSPKIFCEQLDIMRKIIKKYREAEYEEEKDFLLVLLCDSFSKDEY